MLLKDTVLRELLDEAALRSISTLEFIKDQGCATVKEVEANWEKCEFKKIKPRTKSSDPVDNTVRNHLNRLCSRDFLVKIKRGKSFIYELGPASESLKSIRIEKMDIEDMIRWINTFDAFKGIPFYRDVQDMMPKTIQEYIQELNLDPADLEPIIDFEANQVIYSSKLGVNSVLNITKKVAELLAFFYYKIAFKETVKFSYFNFNKKRTSSYTDVEPYLLKQHNKRWYVIFRLKSNGKFLVFALDRIESVDEKFPGNRYHRDPKFSPNKLFEHTVGIMINTDSPPELVSFELKDGETFKNIDYLISSPMHPSQKVEKVEGEEEWVKFSYNIIIGPEVTRQIRQWGVHNVRNIFPPDLDMAVRSG